MHEAVCQNACSTLKSCTAWEYNLSSSECFTYNGKMVGEGFRRSDYKCAIKKSSEDPTT